MIGIVGGISWTSTAHFYKRLNELVNEARGGLHSVECVIASLDLATYAAHAANGNFDALSALVAAAAARTEAAGATFVILCSNTAHVAIPRIMAQTKVPVLHIADCAASEMKRLGFRCALFLGTRYTMEVPFITDVLRSHDLEIVVPTAAADISRLQQIIEDASVNVFTADGRAWLLSLIERLCAEHLRVACVVYGCTELPLVAGDAGPPVAVIDTTEIHVQAAAARYLAHI